MTSEFTLIATNTVRSNRGFAVTFHPIGGVDYSDDCGVAVRVDTELFVGPFRYAVYAQSKDLRSMPRSRSDELLSNVIRALDFLGHRAEIDSG